jgi:hypothetical protein
MMHLNLIGLSASSCQWITGCGVEDEAGGGQNGQQKPEQCTHVWRLTASTIDCGQPAMSLVSLHLVKFKSLARIKEPCIMNLQLFNQRQITHVQKHEAGLYFTKASRYVVPPSQYNYHFNCGWKF